MKTKLFALMWLFAIPAFVFAQCAPDEVIALAKQGYTKAEISKLCPQGGGKAGGSAAKQSEVVTAFLKAMQTKSIKGIPDRIGLWTVKYSRNDNGDLLGIWVKQEVNTGDVRAENQLCMEARKDQDFLAKKLGLTVSYSENDNYDKCWNFASTRKYWYSNKKNGFSVSVDCSAGAYPTCRDFSNSPGSVILSLNLR